MTREFLLSVSFLTEVVCTTTSGIFKRTENAWDALIERWPSDVSVLNTRAMSASRSGAGVEISDTLTSRVLLHA
jgi:hypothetical protein